MTYFYVCNMKIYKYFLMIITVLFLFCAHQIGPSGGPKDETSPVIVATVPAQGTLNHPPKKKIVLHFSEWVDPRNVKKSLTVFPTLMDGYKQNVSGRRIEIIPKKSFADSTTYNIGLNVSLTDYHNVSIGTPYNFFFSTGPSIDSGIIYGCVIHNKTKDEPPKVALYKCLGDTVPDSSFFNLPSYLVQTDSLGFFSLKHIRKGSYEILAFIDADNNNRLTPGKEKAFAPLDKKIILVKEEGAVVLFPVSSDTASARLKSITAISPMVISGEWINEYIAEISDNNNNFLIVSLDSTTKAPQIIHYLPVKGSSSFILKLSDSLTTGSYSLIYKFNPRVYTPLDSQTIKDTLFDLEAMYYDTIRFNGTVYTDTTPPILKSSQPSKLAALGTHISVSWSKPVRSTTTSWFIADTIRDTIPIIIDTLFSNTTQMHPQRKLLPGRNYYFSIPASYFEDFAGNTPDIKIDSTIVYDTISKDSIVSIKIPKDSIPLVKFSFSTISQRQICYSLSGGDSCLSCNDKRIWKFNYFGQPIYPISQDSCGFFRFDSIPSGKGTLSYFIDGDDKDGKYSEGRLFPWKAPEPRYSFADTIEARARWDIEGIQLYAVCEECPTPKVATLEADSLAIDALSDSISGSFKKDSISPKKRKEDN